MITAQKFHSELKKFMVESDKALVALRSMQERGETLEPDLLEESIAQTKMVIALLTRIKEQNENERTDK